MSTAHMITASLAVLMSLFTIAMLFRAAWLVREHDWEMRTTNNAHMAIVTSLGMDHDEVLNNIRTDRRLHIQQNTHKMEALQGLLEVEKDQTLHLSRLNDKLVNDIRVMDNQAEENIALTRDCEEMADTIVEQRRIKAEDDAIAIALEQQALELKATSRDERGALITAGEANLRMTTKLVNLQEGFARMASVQDTERDQIKKLCNEVSDLNEKLNAAHVTIASHEL